MRKQKNLQILTTYVSVYCRSMCNLEKGTCRKGFFSSNPSIVHHPPVNIVSLGKVKKKKHKPCAYACLCHLHQVKNVQNFSLKLALVKT